MNATIVFLVAGLVATFAFLIFRISRGRQQAGTGISGARGVMEASERRHQEEVFRHTPSGKVARILGYFAIIGWVSFIGLTQWYDVTLPTKMDVSVGRLYELGNHSHVVYMTAIERWRLNAVLFGTIALIGGVAAIWISWQRKHPRPAIS